ncbi:D-cysteine desulfhydrase [Bacillus sp. DX1.1]|uniref:D-cysteine desulfhydrase n=1 Tax=unclassified Bacillus (in: firmicutes) TaxID=185979 RepID=UPI00257096A2|nr:MULTISPECIES: D-cysteine desulfhydrase [unclassified Bacillus (in: firmicutes)]MDM5155392.1 D-cysteine desulfhydrase [Bacillus sp. DX1.1]WJE79707.1 D-cysteine desulfhydrase [Bacillus sp. DX3.1]
MNLAKFPRKKYTESYTPIEKLNHFSEVLGGPSIYLKRDDLLGLTAGGNKTRKLEFLVADAQEKGADTLITCGGIQSNHCRLTLAAAVKEKMKCILVLEEGLEEDSKPDFNGNYFLYHLLGAENIKVVPNGTDLMDEMQKVAKEVTEKGNQPYIIPVGGSNATGAMGYVACAQEILAQSFNEGINFDAVVCVSGSGGMHSGLVTGFYGNQSGIPVIGINVSRGKAEQEEKVFQLVKETSAHVGIPNFIPREAVTCFDEYVGPGYALPTPEMVEAVQLLAKTEGILLDPVYTGKAAAGLIDLIRKGTFKQDDNILFVHSGGAPALYANTSLFV